MLWFIHVEEDRGEQAAVSQTYLDLEGSREKTVSIFLVWFFPAQDVVMVARRENFQEESQGWGHLYS